MGGDDRTRTVDGGGRAFELVQQPAGHARRTFGSTSQKPSDLHAH